jgi:hypothetical protein
MMKKILFILFLCGNLGLIYAQETFKLMTYNVLNLNASSTDRFPYFKKIMDATQPDILVLEEIGSQAAMNAFKTNALSGLYACGTFIDGPDSDNCLCYKLTKFKFISNTAIPTALRDINMFKVVNLASGDTLRIFAVHLKASDSQSGSERIQRNEEIKKLRNVTNSLTLNQDWIVCGDFNFYDSNEPAYNTIKNPDGTANGYVIDPINMLNTSDWGASQNIPFHTQSPRVESFGGGSTGGLDDRFDLIMYSKSIANPGGLDFVANSTVAYGNDSQHYNKSINADPTNTAVGQELADALYYAADHLPVIADFIYTQTSINETSFDEIELFPNPTSDHINLTNVQDFKSVTLFDLAGKQLIYKENYSSEISLDLKHLKSGVYILKLANDHSEKVYKVIKE